LRIVIDQGNVNIPCTEIIVNRQPLGTYRLYTTHPLISWQAAAQVEEWVSIKKRVEEWVVCMK
jgi:hypothetical protein